MQELEISSLAHTPQSTHRQAMSIKVIRKQQATEGNWLADYDFFLVTANNCKLTLLHARVAFSTSLYVSNVILYVFFRVASGSWCGSLFWMDGLDGCRHW